ncbi:efflux RND transporter periplasmic adaptor subunit [Beggiatoa leptomitoformis]|uniref:Efflux RND transporter periplasmic adaptor subunit n=2 Tax=Beggiatoa leptomitoformis TaxID=288004 RepID=A0A2N9YA59_9GAMM|nr:efflux RND transporter periplasmic adaptor subunit [Beggiatoa leptomitoformis]AUI67342.1 efflux RND transporter periplasmic adaptor subunit [Beggiatoa leptomitoformis]
MGACIALAAEPYTVREYSIPTTVTLGGTVVPYKEVTFSAQLSGRVERLAGEEGAGFAKDTVLVALNNNELLAQRRSAIAQMMNADATLRNANVQYNRELWSPNSPTQAPGGMGMPNMFDQFFTKPASDFFGQSSSFLDRQADLHRYGTQTEQARNALLQAQSQIEQIDAKLRDTVSKAPFEGVITKKFIEVGDTVQPGQALLQFADTKYLQIVVDVPARLVASLSVGVRVPARLDVANQVIEARVAQIFPTADPQRHTVTVKFDLPISTRTGPGQYAQVEIQDLTIPPQTLAIIPKTALVWRGSLPGVYVLERERRALRLVRIGREMDAQNVSILSGLKAGDTIELSPIPGTTSGWVSAPTETHQ